MSKTLPDAMDIPLLRRVLVAAAQADSLIAADPLWTFAASRFPGVDVAYFNNGSGDIMVVLLGSDAAIVLGFEHESDLSPYNVDPPKVRKGMLRGIPPQLASYVPEVLAPEEGAVTFCCWRTAEQSRWRRTTPELRHETEAEADGWLLDEVPRDATHYLSMAREYFGPAKADEHVSEVTQLFPAQTAGREPEADDDQESFAAALAKLETVQSPKETLGQPCPCGSGATFSKCHGAR